MLRALESNTMRSSEHSKISHMKRNFSKKQGKYTQVWPITQRVPAQLANQKVIVDKLCWNKKQSKIQIKQSKLNFKCQALNEHQQRKKSLLLLCTYVTGRCVVYTLLRWLRRRVRVASWISCTPLAGCAHFDFSSFSLMFMLIIGHFQPFKNYLPHNY